MKESIMLFGVGTGLDLYFSLHDSAETQSIVAILDNGAHGNSYNGFDVDNPENIDNYKFDKVVITSRHYLDIYKQLRSFEIKDNNIEVFIGVLDLL